MHRTIIVGSPRENGRSAGLAGEIFDACIDDCPEDGVSILSISSLDISPCIGCGKCEESLDAEDARTDVPDLGDPLHQSKRVYRSDARFHQCIYEDDMREVRKHIDAADELIVVSPIYFASAPSQLKALMDRLQPYFFSNIREATKDRADLILHMVGESGKPFGFDPLIRSVRSAFGVAGFKLSACYNWIGRIEEDGTIIDDAIEEDPDR